MAFKPRILKRVTVPILKMKLNRPYYIKFTEAIHEGEKLEKQKYDNAANIAQVMNYETGEIALLICNKVLQKEIEKNYAGESYIGRAFEVIVQRHPNPDIKYKLFTISEIAEPSPEDFNPVDNDPENKRADEDDFPESDDSEDPTDSLDTDLSDDIEFHSDEMPAEVSVRNTKGKKGKRVNA